MSYCRPNWYNNTYGHGYNNGYWYGYNDGQYAGNNYYYNSYDANSYYYGHRSSTASNGGRNYLSHAENYQNAVGSEKAFNSKYVDIPKSNINRIEPSRIATESKDRISVQPGKENQTASPERGKMNDMNRYPTPGGLKQSGGNTDYSVPKENRIHNEQPKKTNEIKDIYPEEKNTKRHPAGNYTQPDIEMQKEHRKEYDMDENKYNNQKREEPKNTPGKRGNQPERDNNNLQQRNNAPRENFQRNNPARSTPFQGSGNNEGGKMNSPNVSGGGRSGSNPAPSGSKIKR